MQKALFVSRRAWLLLAAAAIVFVGTQTLHPRELYNQMYPVETLKRDTFRLCSDADPAFIRAVRSDREACYNSMPHAIAVALGRVRPDSAAIAALLDPAHQIELQRALAAMRPRQPLTTPRSYDNAAWLRSLAAGCADKAPAPAVAYSGPVASAGGQPGDATLDSTMLRNLPPLPHAAKAGVAAPQDVPILSLSRGGAVTAASPPAADPAPAAAFAPLPTPDVGDKEAPAIVPLAPATACGA
jgi:hypothetical protein